MTVEELVGVLGHELGHWSHSHSLQNFVVVQIYTGLAFFTYGCPLPTQATPLRPSVTKAEEPSPSKSKHARIS